MRCEARSEHLTSRVSHPTFCMSVKVNVVCGGDSKERAISIKSGKAVYEAIKKVYDTKIQIISNINECATDCDVVFIALHGGFGENGDIQKYLEEKQIAYTGPDSICSQICIDKLQTLDLLRTNGIPVPNYTVNTDVLNIFDSDNYVLIPRFEGSTIGVQTASRKDLKRAIKTFNYTEFICEKYIEGTELTVGYLGNMLLPVIQINYEGEIFDFNAKYSSEKTKYIIPAQIDSGAEDTIMNYCNQIISILKIEHLARIDLKLDRTGKPYFLEVNTIPGFTDRSLVPMAAKHIGIGYLETCEILINSALERQKR